jgi:hypothetical protein
VADNSVLPAAVSFSSSQLLSIIPIFLAAGVLRVRNCRVTSWISGSAGPLSTFTPITVVIRCSKNPKSLCGRCPSPHDRPRHRVDHC